MDPLGVAFATSFRGIKPKLKTIGPLRSLQSRLPPWDKTQVKNNWTPWETAKQTPSGG